MRAKLMILLAISALTCSIGAAPQPLTIGGALDISASLNDTAVLLNDQSSWVVVNLTLSSSAEWAEVDMTGADFSKSIKILPGVTIVSAPRTNLTIAASILTTEGGFNQTVAGEAKIYLAQVEAEVAGHPDLLIGAFILALLSSFTGSWIWSPRRRKKVGEEVETPFE